MASGSWRWTSGIAKTIDLVGPALIRFDADGTGDFRFIAVRLGSRPKARQISATVW
jgi:hypothetical protein